LLKKYAINRKLTPARNIENEETETPSFINDTNKE
jgi:hypothetical protein